MSKRHKMTIACDISPRTRERVLGRDAKSCILCGSTYPLEIAHYIGRAQGGLGIPENLVTLCKKCHSDYDNSDKREMMKPEIEAYLEGWYGEIDKSKLVYNKYDWIDDLSAKIEP